MRVALDATYSVSERPSGIAIYSRQILDGLSASYTEDEFFHCYRWKQFRAVNRKEDPSNVKRRLLLPPLPVGRCEIFHGLNQRIDARLGKNVVCTFHDLFVMSGEYSTADFRKRFSQQARQAVSNSDLFISVTDFTASQMTDLLGVPSSRIRIVPHGVMTPPTPVPAMTRRAKVILFAGVLQLRKNISRLVRAFRAVPNDWKLVLAGSTNGYGAEQIFRDIDASPARDRIEVLGYTPQDVLNRLYSEAAFFAFPSLDEGFGMPILEAMSYGLPVLTANRSGTAEVGAGAALMVNPFLEEEIADGMCRLVRDEALRLELAIKGRERAKQFPWQMAWSSTYAAYRELAAR